MPEYKAPRISTDLGVIKFGLCSADAQYNVLVRQVPETDFFSFFGIRLSEKPDIEFNGGEYDFRNKPHKTATLKNGNEINVKTAYNRVGNYIAIIEFNDKIAGTRRQGVTTYMYGSNPGKPNQIGFFYDYTYTPNGNPWYRIFTPSDAPNERFFEVGTRIRSWSPAWDKNQWNSFINGSLAPEFPGPDNTEDPEGGDGDGEIEDDPIEFPEKPGITVTDAGLMTLYTPTQGQIHAFGDFLWSDAFSLDTFKKLFADPMQAVIGLSIVPVSVPTAGAQPITIGAISSGVTANRAASQYVVHDCGTLKVNPVWNTALDFSPYTKFSIYLPFIGTRELKTDDIMGKELNVKYFVDVLSGACTAHISVGGSVLYQFSGSCATPVPLSAMNWNSTLTSMIQLAGAGIAMAVTGGAAAPSAAGMLTTATGMIGNKPNVQRSGAVSGAAGMLGVKTPYLIRETPRQSLAKDYAHYSGYPSNITAVLGTLKGFTMVENMHLKNIDATADELDEIETALKEGVIL